MSSGLITLQEIMERMIAHLDNIRGRVDRTGGTMTYSLEGGGTVQIPEAPVRYPSSHEYITEKDNRPTGGHGNYHGPSR